MIIIKSFFVFNDNFREFDFKFCDFYPESEWDIKLSSAGLVYVHFGHEILSTLLKKSIDDDLIKILFKKVQYCFIIHSYTVLLL